DDLMRCWGAGNFGQTGYSLNTALGDNETVDTLVGIMLGGIPTQAFEAGGSHTCVVLDTGDVLCWGANSQGQLGQGSIATIGDDEHPAMGTTVDLGGDDVTIVATGLNHSCAVTSLDDLYCWGDNNHGQLGYG